ncbi:MAG: S1C family serine protease [Pseudohongiellaceae bacterium]|jgi:S1-C subfamily serine protease
MNLKKSIGVIIIFSWGLLALLLPALEASSADYRSFQTEDEANTIEIFKQASASVVYVTNTAYRRSGIFSLNLQEIPQGAGTGFVWDKSGLVVTNFHVIQGASKVTITLQDQSTWEATLVGRSPDKDLALLRIDAPADKLYPLPLGDSSTLEVGRKVIAIGNPFGLDTTLTVGVVSALGREINSLTNRTIRDVIQTDAAINPGNSGGPLLNSLGQLVGVNTQIVSPSGAYAGIGFAIPVNTVKKIVPQLLEHGKEVRPVIGVDLSLSESLSSRYRINGLPITRVFDGTPAANAGLIGLQQNSRGDLFLGDVILEVEGQPVSNQDDLLNILEQYRPGDAVKVMTQRNQETLEFEVVLAAPS